MKLDVIVEDHVNYKNEYARQFRVNHIIIFLFAS